VAITSGPTGGRRCLRYGTLLKRGSGVRLSWSRSGSFNGLPRPGVARELPFKSHFNFLTPPEVKLVVRFCGAAWGGAEVAPRFPWSWRACVCVCGGGGANGNAVAAGPPRRSPLPDPDPVSFLQRYQHVRRSKEKKTSPGARFLASPGVSFLQRYQYVRRSKERKKLPPARVS
jgi:hypothetical protein